MRTKLGQNFLKDKNKIREIGDALCAASNETIVEIGAGHGELTNELRRRNNELRIITIEKDAKLIPLLKEKFGASKNIEIIEGDALKILPSLIHNSKFPPKARLARGGTIQNYKIVGNIPYYITGRLFRVLGELKTKPKTAVLTIQKEVALRICAQPPQMNLLAATVQVWAEPEIVDFIPKTSFSPQPEVDAAILRLKIKSGGEQTPEKYYQLVKLIFRQPRKTILNNLKAANTRPLPEILTILHKNNLNGSERPQNLSVKTLKTLAIMLYND